MKKLLLLATALIFTTHYAHAAARQSATFSCGSSVTLPVTSFYLEIPNSTATSGQQYVTVTTDLNQFQSLFLLAIEGKHLSTCEVQVTNKETGTTAPLKFIEVYASLVSITADKQTQYVTATFNFSKIEDLAGNTTASSNGAAALTPEQQNKALTEFLARAPKPSAD